MVQYPPYWRAKECDKTPLGNENKEKSHFSSYLCFILESGTFSCGPAWHILYHVTSSCTCKRPIGAETPTGITDRSLHIQLLGRTHLANVIDFTDRVFIYDCLNQLMHRSFTITRKR